MKRREEEEKERSPSLNVMNECYENLTSNECRYLWGCAQKRYGEGNESNPLFVLWGRHAPQIVLPRSGAYHTCWEEKGQKKTPKLTSEAKRPPHGKAKQMAF